VVVNSDLEILQFRGSTGLYLDPSPGKASLNLLKMAHPDIALELRNIIHKVSKSATSVRKSGIVINTNGAQRQLAIEAIPVSTENEDRIFLVIFEELAEPKTEPSLSAPSKNKIVNQLQSELAALREDMRAIVEDQEASNEELQSANEEIVSSNEELQSINEELETSKEEMESTNEE
jgi:two-component system CheB/CheR fusion protein